MDIDIRYNRLLIFDGSFVLHRALSVPNNWDMRTSYGKRTGGIFASLRTFLKEIKMFNYCPVVVYDGGLSKRRLDIFPNYKRTLDKQELYESDHILTEEEQMELEFRREYNTQRNDIIPLLRDLGIPVINIKDWEGDDIIYILSKLSKDSIIVSEDRDLIQLVSNNDRRCRIRRPIREELIDINYLQEHNIDLNSYVACKAICGDNSDNIPSACFQVGEKTAPSLYKLYVESKNNFPKTEEELTKLCKNTNIPKRKAYLNFNEEQFLNNVLLMDLRFVDNYIDNTLLDQIITEIDTSLINTQGIEDLLSRFEITSFNTKELIDKVKILSDFKRLNFDTSNIKDINKIIPGENCSYNSVSAMLFLNN